MFDNICSFSLNDVPGFIKAIDMAFSLYLLRGHISAIANWSSPVHRLSLCLRNILKHSCFIAGCNSFRKIGLVDFFRWCERKYSSRIFHQTYKMSSIDMYVDFANNKLSRAKSAASEYACENRLKRQFCNLFVFWVKFSNYIAYYIWQHVIQCDFQTFRLSMCRDRLELYSI